MKHIKLRKFIYILISMLLFLNIAGFVLSNLNPNRTLLNDDINIPQTSQFISKNIRVAIYDEANTTTPSYTGVGLLTNNHSLIQAALIAAGYDVTPLTTNQIYNHELRTADYDVFIMADHLPRENITNYVKEFWLGGGALLSIESALSYICYAGILPPESAGDDGYTTYWTYQFSTDQNITARHPVSKSYALNDTFTIDDSFSSATFSWTALQGTSIANEVVKIATRPGLPNAATVVAFEPQSAGGKVVHLPNIGDIEDDMILIDAIEWLCPRPKGRLLFDLTHKPEYGIDPWDDLSDNPGFYEIWRDNLVNRSYTIDKLYPSPFGNLSASNLAPYDVLILSFTDYNYSTSEINVVRDWVDNGGGLFIIGDQHDYQPHKTLALNDLLTHFDISFNETSDGTNTVTEVFNHPINEGVSQITALAPGLVNIDGNAFPILGNDLSNIIVGGEEYGGGRIVLNADLATLRDSGIEDFDSLQFGINLVNWLTADDAEILVFVYEHSSPDPNDNIYRSPIATALNDLGCPFYMTFDETYLNLSLTDTSYKLVIIDNVMNYIMDTVGVTLLEFLKSGGYLILNTWEYRTATYNYLWDYLGFSYAGNYFNVPQTINIWDTNHPIFKTPADYGATTIETSLNFAGTDYTNLTLHSNATGIAGLTSSANSSTAAIILGANGRAITNAMHLTEYYDDTDDSTYPDALEIWENEIAYMVDLMTPVITPGGGIPGFEIGTFLLVTFSTIGVISVISIMKKKN